MLPRRFTDCIRALKVGAKDVCYQSDAELDPMDVIIHMEDNDIHTIHIKHPKGGYRYFFYIDHEQRKKIMDSDVYSLFIGDAELGIPIGRRNPVYHLDFGRLLGFPPAATKEFVKREKTGDSFAINYCGIQFASYPTTIEDDLRWLFENKNPKVESEFLLEISKNRTGNIILISDKHVTVRKKGKVEGLIKELKRANVI